MTDHNNKIIIKDSTLREGMDVSGVDFSLGQRIKLAKLISQAHVPEAEVVAPARVLKDLEFVKRLRKEKVKIKTSGLIYCFNPNYKQEVRAASKYLDRFDVLMSVSPKREPFDSRTKIRILIDALVYSLESHVEVGVGFPQSTQTKAEFLLKISKEAQNKGARRITIYDTNGGSDPFRVYILIKELKKNLRVPVFFHGHNDLGLATANSLVAVCAGADGLDATVNGLGDRAGNCALEQIVLCLHLKGYKTGIKLENLKLLSKSVEKESGIAVSKIAPIVGEHIFTHKSAGHFGKLRLFEAFDPRLVGLHRRSV